MSGRQGSAFPSACSSRTSGAGGLSRVDPHRTVPRPAVHTDTGDEHGACLYLRISLSSAVCGMATLRSGTCGCRHAAVEPRKGRSERLQEEGVGADRPDTPLVLVELKDC